VKHFLPSQLLAIFVAFLAAAQDRVTFRVITPFPIPADAQVCVAGNHPDLGDWSPGRVALHREDDTTWAKSFPFKRGTELEFKITLGSWNRQAIYVPGVIPANTRLIVAGDTTVTIRPVVWSNEGVLREGGIVGTVKYHRALTGKGLRYARDLIVWLPPSYGRQQERRYPVLYMHDGQNIIDPATSFIGYDWHADEVADSLIRAGEMQEIIIVGIDNTPDRLSEYSGTELGRAYADFVIGTVKPLIDSAYRTLPDRPHTAVMGSSMGGLISFLFLWWHPEVFSKAGCLSSVFDGRASEVLKMVRTASAPPRDVRIYLDCGGYGGEASLKPGVDEMVRLLLQKGFHEGADVMWFFDPQAEHSERAWASRLWRPFLFLFGNGREVPGSTH